jgi:hypothetical protein
MKQEGNPKSLAELSAEAAETQLANPAQPHPNPSPSDEQQPQEAQLPTRAPQYSGFAGYPHWGLNE